MKNIALCFLIIITGCSSNNVKENTTNIIKTEVYNVTNEPYIMPNIDEQMLEVSYFSEFYRDTNEILNSEEILNLNMQYLSNPELKLNDMTIINETSKYGIVVRRTNLRTYPNMEPRYIDNNMDIDFNQETVLEVNEPIEIIDTQDDFLKVKSYNYIGWVKSDNIAFVSNEQYINYINDDKFLVITSNKITINTEDSTSLYMGNKIHYIKENKNNYKIKLPYKNGEGNLEYNYIHINKTDYLNKGYLKYTKQNIIKQAFKMLNDKYGWGGLNNLRDCSSFIADIYKTFGIYLPRNTSEQKKIKSVSTNLEKIDEGSLIFIPGHVMLYLGKSNNNYYVIHNLYTYYSTKTIKVEKVVISDLNIFKSTTKSFLDRIENIVFIR